ncbi:hypothetical protein DPMN_181043 [Dreissena polymorpha]|uniref:Uncharacterized protein n=1 Tax=Dreissena polymorpha TaxID=45954 RepID=A0A9D4I3E1_DREPO|nr:hypothetical protein DPMN_181043 [Dreissena polymorpha]
MPTQPLMDRVLKCVPGLSRTHMYNQGIKTVVPGSYTAVPGPHTAATRTIPYGAIIPDRHGSTRQFCTSQNYRVCLPERQGPSLTSRYLQGSTRNYTC